MSNAKKSSTKKPSRQQIIHNAVSSLQRLEASLGIDPAMLPNERKRIQGLGTVPTMAITIAANIAKQTRCRIGALCLRPATFTPSPLAG